MQTGQGSELKSYTFDTPIGRMNVCEKENGICTVTIWDKVVLRTDKESLGTEEQPTELLLKAEQELLEYFAGKRKEFDLPLHLEGTPFQLKVWNALLTIPYGETRSYKEIARLTGNEKA